MMDCDSLPPLPPPGIMAGLYKAELLVRRPSARLDPPKLFGLQRPGEMQQSRRLVRSRAAAALCIVLLMLAQQACAGPLASRLQPDQSPDASEAHVLRRVARMTPLWRIMSSKPFGAYCQNNYECSTGLCRAGHCSAGHRPASEPVKY